ncbi:hypothetical protein R77555_00875 [Ralstonia mannitolilytica]|uniref:helix-turn-helix domain-containing protein n=1 Tax=Ralstonia mannitolilytica TaxID=105219 RepID=UPI0013DD8B2F|nr:helix-turn-helix transcriptional regulator [Ralstonia mannitolilytica]QIF07485.1 helix-turn-helix transcriptional regulator [Ralstonia mannitolilytica]CAJ0781928.1 hypothetical protein R77555_00875 [Ralstonia mannitolilytica]
MRIEKYLDDLRDKLGVKTDKEVIAKLGWSTGTISNWRKGRMFMTNQTAGQVAELLGVPVIQIIAAVEADREEVTGQKSFWTAFFQRTVSQAAPAALLLALGASVTNFVTPTTLQAFNHAIAAGQRFALC